MPSFQRVNSVSAAVAILCVTSCFAMRFSAFGQDAGPARPKLTSLLEERRDVLKARVETLEALFKMGKSPYEAIMAARDDLFDAEYEFAAGRAQRRDVLQRRVANAQEFEAIMKQRKEMARVSEADVLQATARRLGAEIALLREVSPDEAQR